MRILLVLATIFWKRVRDKFFLAIPIYLGTSIVRNVRHFSAVEKTLWLCDANILDKHCAIDVVRDAEMMRYTIALLPEQDAKVLLNGNEIATGVALKHVQT